MEAKKYGHPSVEECLTCLVDSQVSPHMHTLSSIIVWLRSSVAADGQ